MKNSISSEIKYAKCYVQCKVNALFMLSDCFQVLKIGKNFQTVSDLIGASTHLA